MRRQHRRDRAAGDDCAVHGAADPPAREAVSAPPVRRTPRPTKVLVTVVDGDTHRRVKGARVVIGRRADYANTRGLASVKIKRRTALPVRVSKPGYAARRSCGCPSSASVR